MAGVRVQAFDGDIAQHDLLGSAVTDALGRFRIDYKSEDFRDTPIPWGNFEAVARTSSSECRATMAPFC
jgi:hypothetical protein